jgi:hypothetical protein
MPELGLLGLLVVAAGVIEHVVRRLKLEAGLTGWKVEAVAYGLGVLTATGLNLHAFSTLGASAGISPAPWADAVLTGLTLGSGSAAVHRFFGRGDDGSGWDPSDLP